MNNRTWLACALFPLLACCGNPYGMTSDSPLGDFKTLDALLTGKGLVKEVDRMHLENMDHDPETEPAGFSNEGGVRYSYIDRARVGDMHAAYVFVDGDEKVAGIGGRFRSDTRGVDYGVYKVTRFIADVWLTVNGATPNFQLAHSKNGMIGKEMLVATFDQGPIKGRWVKHVLGGGMRDKVLDEVSIVFK